MTQNITDREERDQAAKRRKEAEEKDWSDEEDDEEHRSNLKERGDNLKRNRWGETPKVSSWDMPTPKVGRSSKWDVTPQVSSGGFSASTPLLTPMHASQMTPDQINLLKAQHDFDSKNRPWTDLEIDAMLPEKGYEIVLPPAGYQPPAHSQAMLLATPTPYSATPAAFEILPETKIQDYGGIVPAVTDPELPQLKPEDVQFFGTLVEQADEDIVDKAQKKERQILKLLLQVKNGTPPMRKFALRQITDGARDFGAGPLFNCILPLLMSPTLEDQERHLLVKVIGRILYKLEDQVRPYVHKILVVIEPLLIDEDYYARVEGREIISNLAKAAGLATMIATMRPDIDNIDEYVRNTTARAFAVVASALGIPSMLPFLKAVCDSKKSWEARHTGVKIVQQIAILMGCGILPQLTQLVSIIKNGLTDEIPKVRTVTALALASLAEAAAPYGIESFDPVLEPLWAGVSEYRGKSLAAFLKAIGFIIPLMEPKYAHYYTQHVMLTIIREFQSPDEEMRRIVLTVVKQCIQTEGVEVNYVKYDIMPEFFRNFWVRKMALDRKNYKYLVETTLALAIKVGGASVVSQIADGLKDESEPFRRMVMEAIDSILTTLGATDIDQNLEERLIDGILFAFQEQAPDDSMTIINGFGVVLNSLGIRAKPYLQQISSVIKWRLNNRSAKIRQQACDLISRVANAMKS
jgi:splicing factor 3B subunit 1